MRFIGICIRGFDLIRAYHVRAHIRMRSLYWKLLIEARGGKVGKNFRTRRGAYFVINRGAKITIGSDVVIAEDVSFHVGQGAVLFIGDHVFIGRGSVIASNLKVEIGSGTQIAHYVTLIDTDHVFDQPHLSLLEQGGESQPIQIGKEAWIAAQAVILKGRQIGDHAVIGACTVTSRDVPAYTVVAGNPLREIRSFKP